MIDPKNDGIDHINVYSKATTELGLFLSNFALAPIETIDGSFRSIEGYWYWLGTDHPNRDSLRRMYGFEAKRFGRSLGASDWDDTELFIEKIKKAIKIKILSHERMLPKFIESTLPFKHYYVYGDKSTEGKYKVVEAKQGDWMIDYLEELRHNFKNESNHG